MCVLSAVGPCSLENRDVGEVVMWKQKDWSDLTQVQKTGIVVLGIVQVTLLAAAQWDIHTRPEEEIRGNKWIWTVVAFVNFVGPIAYFLLGRSSAGHKRVVLVE